jgi:hypothetical protein
MGKEQTELLAELRLCETRVWKALVQGDMQADAETLHPDFLGVYSDGFAEKSDHIQQLEDGPTVRNFTLSDCRVLPLGQDYAVISYRAEFQRITKTTTETLYVSSIWQRNEGSWINVFSQDTPAID